LAIHRQSLGEQHPGTATSYNNVAYNLDAQGKYAAAQPLYENALAIRRQALGEQHSDTATSYNNLAQNLNEQGKYAEAQSLLQKALAIWRQALGEQHPDTAIGYYNVAANLKAQGKTREAIPHWQAAASISEIARLHAATSGFERSLYKRNHLAPQAALAVTFADLHEPARAWEYAEAYLARGLLDDLDPAARHHSLAPARLAKIDEQLVPLLSRSNLSATERDRRDALRKEADALRTALNQAAAERAAKRVWPLAKIQAAIPADAAILLWLDVQKAHWACILRQSGVPIWQRLPGTGPGQAWTRDDDNLAERTYTQALVEPQAPQRDQLLAALRAQRLVPLLPHLNGIQRLLVVPTGYMAKIPLEALTDQFLVSYIPSASIYAKLHQEHRPLAGGTLLALGDPVFTSPSDKPRAGPDHGVLISLVVSGSNADRHGLKAGDILLSYNRQALRSYSDLKAEATGPPMPTELWREGQTVAICLDPGKVGVVLDKRPAAEALVAWRASDYLQVAQRADPIQPLPGTRVEVEALARLVPQAKLLLGSDASEQTLEQMARAGQLHQYRLIHLATHGQVNEDWPTESALLLAQDRISRQLNDQVARALGSKKPLDGRLTVGTIRDTWELDADQVVLSACETGLGTNASGEGLLGFAQALLHKGARSVVLSRWKVPDTATALLMQRYYQNILGRRAGLKGPLPRAEGLREAKQWLRQLSKADVAQLQGQLPRVRGEEREGQPAPVAPGRPFEAPYYWAAFILNGDPE
jgi:CHAT domain-containing protein